MDLGPGDDHLYRSGYDDVDCGPGLDTIHATREFADHPTPVPLDEYRGARRGVISNCELIVTDDTTDPQGRSYVDITLGWTNPGRRAGAGRSTDVSRYRFVLSSGDDRFPASDPSVFLHNMTFVRGATAAPIGTLILGRGGDDIISASPGSDHLEGEAGNDLLAGGGGKDLLHGRTGDDVLLGDGGDDTLEGGRGRDTLDGAAGNDRLTGGYDRDTLRGGSGRDRIVAVDGARDVVSCGAGRDIAFVDRRDSVRGCERVERG